MYTALLVIHSWLRWVVVFSGVAALGGAAGGVATRRAWLPVDDLRTRLFAISLDVQFLIGLILYVALSPVTQAGFANIGGTMRDPVLRFYVVEHITGMVVALALAHIGRARLRKAADAAARHRTVLIFVGLAMVALLLSIPWPGMPGGRVLFRGLGGQ
jgi:hypothetical protein